VRGKPAVRVCVCVRGWRARGERATRSRRAGEQRALGSHVLALRKQKLAPGAEKHATRVTLKDTRVACLWATRVSLSDTRHACRVLLSDTRRQRHARHVSGRVVVTRQETSGGASVRVE